MSDSKKLDVFISYARSDDEPFAQRLHDDLRSHGVKVWWDRALMESRGRSFLQEIRDAIASSDRLIAVLGNGAAESDYVRYEWEYACSFGTVVVPILRVGDYKSVLEPIIRKDASGQIARAFDNAHQIDFRSPRPYEQALAELLRVISSPVAKPGAFHRVPADPPHFLPRTEELGWLYKALLIDVTEPMAVKPEQRVAVLHGMSGVGKSVLAASFARAVDTRRAFEDGIVWLSTKVNRTEMNVVRNIESLYLALTGERERFPNEEIALRQMSEKSNKKAFLVVLDDAWSVKHVDPFRNVLNQRSSLLVTTRDESLAINLNAVHRAVQPLSDDEALKLLAQWTDGLEDPASAREAAALCGNLPLALAQIGGFVRENPDRWQNALHRLRHSQFEKLAKQLPNYPYVNVLQAIHVSVEALESEQQRRYVELAVFAEGLPIPEMALRTLWAQEGLDSFDTEELVDLFARRSLATRQDGNSVVLHDLQWVYVRGQVKNPASLHKKLLAGYRASLAGGWESGPDDGHYFQFLGLHLSEAGETDELRRLLLDHAWLQAKIQATDVAALLADFELVDLDTEMALVRMSLQRSADVLARDPSELANQLSGRLRQSDQPGINALVAQIDRVLDSPALRLLTASLTTPDAAATGSGIGHETEVTDVAAAGDGSKIVSVSADGTIKVWNGETAALVRAMDVRPSHAVAAAVSANGTRCATALAHEIVVWDTDSGNKLASFADAGVTVVHFTPDGRRLVAGASRRVRVWEVDGGALLHTLESDSPDRAVLALGPGGRRVIFGGREGSSREYDYALKLWDINTGELLHSLEGHPCPVNDVAFSPDGLWAASAPNPGLYFFQDPTVKIWNLRTGALARSLEGHRFTVGTVATTPDNVHVVTGGASCFQRYSLDFAVKLWHVEEMEPLASFEGHCGPVRYLRVDPKGRIAVSGGGGCSAPEFDNLQSRKYNAGPVDFSVRVWDLEKHAHLKTFTGEERVTSLCFAAPLTVVAGSLNGAVHILRLSW